MIEKYKSLVALRSLNTDLLLQFERLRRDVKKIQNEFIGTKVAANSFRLEVEEENLYRFKIFVARKFKEVLETPFPFLAKKFVDLTAANAIVPATMESTEYDRKLREFLIWALHCTNRRDISISMFLPHFNCYLKFLQLMLLYRSILKLFGICAANWEYLRLFKNILFCVSSGKSTMYQSGSLLWIRELRWTCKGN